MMTLQCDSAEGALRRQMMNPCSKLLLGPPAKSNSSVIG
jgi:hypothetical protein